MVEWTDYNAREEEREGEREGKYTRSKDAQRTDTYSGEAFRNFNAEKRRKGSEEVKCRGCRGVEKGDYLGKVRSG